MLTYEHIPFAVLILVSSLQAIPQDKINAAHLLGAGIPRIVVTMILPLTMPGLVASAILVFALSASSYLMPILIGAPRIKVLPLQIFSYGTELLNWPMVAALAFLVLIIVVTICARDEMSCPVRMGSRISLWSNGASCWEAGQRPK